MVVKSYTLGELQTNCYLIFSKETKEAIILDPADEANFISEQILQLKLNIKYIVATHGHFDHILAAWELQLAFNIPFLIHRSDLFLLKNMQKSGTKWLKREIIEQPPQKIGFIKDKDKIVLNSQVFQIIHTPGHTPGSICLYSEAEKILFSGDTIFSDGIGRTDLKYSSQKDLNLSMNKLLSLPKQTITYPGHGENFSLGNFK